MTQGEKLKYEYERRLEVLKTEYEHKLSELNALQQNCIHNWEETKYDPEEVDEPVYETRWQGVDCFPECVGTKKVRKDRWSRVCSKCGKVEYTKERVAVKYEPKF